MYVSPTLTVCVAAGSGYFMISVSGPEETVAADGASKVINWTNAVEKRFSDFAEFHSALTVISTLDRSLMEFISVDG
jgi:hypothetical protein